MKKNQLITGVVIIVVALAAFFGGMYYQRMQRSTAFGQGARQFQFQGMNRQNMMNRPVAGEIISMDDKSVTVKMMDGSTKLVLLSESTSMTEATSASKQALQNGKQVLVIGNQNSDGSVTATNIQIGTTNFGFRVQGSGK